MQTHSIKILNNKFIQIDAIEMSAENDKSTIVDFSIDKQSQIVGALFENSLWFTNMKLRTAGNNVNKCNNNNECHNANSNYKKYNKI